MAGKYVPLSSLKPGNVARVRELTMGGNLRRRMLDLGLIRGTRIEVINRSPFGGSGGIFISRGSHRSSE